MRRILIVALIVLSTFSVNGCVRTNPVSSPSFEASSSNRPIVEKGIKMALLNRGWTIISQKPGRYEARYDRGDISVTISVVYAGSRVSINYVDSTNLLYGTDGAGQPIIHRRYNTWIANLERDIRNNIAALS